MVFEDSGQAVAEGVKLFISLEQAFYGGGLSGDSQPVKVLVCYDISGVEGLIGPVVTGAWLGGSGRQQDKEDRDQKKWMPVRQV
jgi:hypothetical protein